MDDNDDNDDAVDLFRSLLMKAAWNATGRQWRARRQLPAVAVAVVAADARTKAVAERIDSMPMMLMMTLLLLLNLLRILEANGEKRRGGGISHANYSSTAAVAMDGPGPPGST